MCPKEILFDMTEKIIQTGSTEQRKAVWDWVTRAVPNTLVPVEFMNAWNACDVLVWVDHAAIYSPYFR